MRKLFLGALLCACSSTDNVSDSAEVAQTVEFLNVRSEEVTADRAVLRFDTSIPTTCEAIYGFAPEALTLTATDPEMAEGELSLDHQVPLEDLMPGQLYYWRARATDAAGVTSLSDLFQFTTLQAEAAEVVMTNFALASAGTAVMDVSSNFGGGDMDSTWGANKAIDGMMGTEWATSGDGDGAWLELDFGQPRTLEQFAFRSREMTDGSSIIQSVQLVVDGDQVLGPFMTPDPAERYVFDLEPVIEAQTVRVQALQTTGGNTGAREIQFLQAE